MLEFITAFALEEGGVTSIEYALLAGIIGLTLATVMPIFADSTSGLFGYVASNVVATAQ